MARELGISLRSLYRDIATLTAQGAPIEGAAGLGYVLKPGYLLPPLPFSEDELDAIILGLRLAAQRGDEELEAAANDALAKIEAVLPAEQESAAASSGMLAGPGRKGELPHFATIRKAMHAEHKLKLCYIDKKGLASERTVWPVAVGFFDIAEVLAAWCETRNDFRHFRLDRIQTAVAAGVRYPRRRRILLADWRLQQDFDGMG